jgi:phenylacetate-coenzyme A ligase PaaK-like adenylate-forming protein
MHILQKHAYVAAVKGHFAGVTMTNAGKKLPFLYQDIQTLDINQPFQQIIDALNTMQPNSLGGYAFALCKLAEAQRNGRISITPTIIHSAGEPLSQQDKDIIQNVFHTSVVNVHGTSEHLMMGIGKDEFDGMYLMEDDLIFEIHPTYTCVTNLFNDTLPLIRYRMSDILQPDADKNQLMPFTKVANLLGRNESIPIFMNNRGDEDFNSPIILVEFYVPHIKQFQFHITNKSHFTFKACLEDGLQQEETELTLQKITARLRNILDEKLMTNVTFTVELVDHLTTVQKI